MTNRYIRRTVITAKPEVTYGVDPVPTGAADAVLVSNMSITPLDAQYIDRALVRGYMGGSDMLVGPASLKVSFDVELAGSGSAATAPQWGDLLLACGFAEASLTTPNRVEYTPISTALKSLTIYYYDDGVLHKLLGCMGTVKITAKVGEIPKFSFEFTGLDGGISAVANATPTLTAWRTPVVVSKASSVDLTLGCTYATGAISGGTVYPTSGLELDIGNQVAFTPLISTETVDITDRNITGSAQFDLTAAQEVTFMTDVKAGALTGLGLTIGTVTGNKFIIFGPAVQRTAPTKAELNGSRMHGYTLGFKPSAGNDELRIVQV